MTTERILGELLTDVKHILAKLDDIKADQDKHDDRISVLEKTKTYMIGAVSTVSAAITFVWFALENKISVIIGAIK